MGDCLPSRDVLVTTIEFRDEMLFKFREIWYVEYLLCFRENCRELHETNYSEKIRIDDVVLIEKSCQAQTLLATLESS